MQEEAAHVATKRTKSADSGQVVDVLPASGPTDLATALPSSLSVEVKLPAPVRKRPSHEAAVAIAPVTVDPGVFDTATVSTTSIEIVHTGPVDLHLEPVPELPEAADSLTEERLISPRRRAKPAPEGWWPELVYGVSFHLINVGDSARVRERKALDARIAKKF